MDGSNEAAETAVGLEDEDLGLGVRGFRGLEALTAILVLHIRICEKTVDKRERNKKKNEEGNWEIDWKVRFEKINEMNDIDRYESIEHAWVRPEKRICLLLSGLEFVCYLSVSIYQKSCTPNYSSWLFVTFSMHFFIQSLNSNTLLYWLYLVCVNARTFQAFTFSSMCL